MRIGLDRGVVAAVACFVLLDVSAATAACIAIPASDADIKKFQANPSSIFTAASDNRTTEIVIRDLVSTDTSLAAGMVKLAEKSSSSSKMVIAAGLAQAAIACGASDPAAALLIQQAVANSPDGQFQVAFAAVAGDLSTAAAAVAAESAASAVGSVTVKNVNSSPRPQPPASGAGSLPVVQITAGAAPITAVNGTAADVPSKTSATPVSATK